MGLGAKSYMNKGFLIYEEMRKYLTLYEEAVGHTTLHPVPSEFLIYEGKKNFIFIFFSVT
jgi:hypothetical protein